MAGLQDQGNRGPVRKTAKAARAFGDRLRKEGGVGVSILIEPESDFRFESLDGGRVSGKMNNAENGLNIVTLDACRDNPFARDFRFLIVTRTMKV